MRVLSTPVATEGIVTKLWSQGSGVLGPFSRFSENAGHKNISKVSSSHFNLPFVFL